jgi:MtN3 and saliva related transmembrane protein
MDITTLLGTLAGSLTTLAFIPQVVRTWRTGSARDISLLTFLLFSCGVLLWLLYGIRLHAAPIILANGVTLLLSGLILAMKIRDLLAQRRRHAAIDQRIP